MSARGRIVIGTLFLLASVFIVCAQTVERVSLDGLGNQGNNDSYYVSSVNANGDYVAFTSDATNLVPGDTNGVRDIFVRDRVTGTTERVSVSNAGVEGNDVSEYPDISDDGRFVAFQSSADNLVPGDTNSSNDTFVYDRQNMTIERVSVDSMGNQASWYATYPAISGDGRFVAYYSAANNLVAGDTNGFGDFFLHDRQTGTTIRVSVDSLGNQSVSQGSLNPAPGVSLDRIGRFVAFASLSTDLVPGDTNGHQDIFVRDVALGTTERVNVDSLGNEANDWSYCPAITDDGRYVVFLSRASNLVAGDTNVWIDAFVHDRQTGVTQRVSVDDLGNEGNSSGCSGSFGVPQRVGISDDGRYVVFSSCLTGLVPGDSNGVVDVFRYDRFASAIKRVSVDALGGEGNGMSEMPSTNADGCYISYVSWATNLVSGDTNGSGDIFLYSDCMLTPTLTPTVVPTVTLTPTPAPSSEPQLSLQKLAPRSIEEGETLVYRIVYSNEGTGDIANLRISDTIPAAFSYLSSTGNVNGNVVSWDIGDVPAGAGGTLTLRVGTLEGAEGKQVSNTVYGAYNAAWDGLPRVPVSAENEIWVLTEPAFYIDKNIFNPSAGEEVKLTWKVKASDKVFLGVYNTAGELVRVLYRGPAKVFTVGVVDWDGRNDKGDLLASGVYIIYLSGSRSYYRKVVIIK